MKAVINYVLASNIANYHFYSRNLFLDDRYACTDLSANLFEDMNLIGDGI